MIPYIVKKSNIFLFSTTFTGLLLSSCAWKSNTHEKPNVIYILADDLGYGDLGCYGQEKVLTPNIDKLASEGLLFSQHYSGSTVCAPSRSSLMTGQHTGNTYIRGNRPHGVEGQFPLDSGSYTIANMMKDAGYTTGAFGKWGLGMHYTEGCPNKIGFDTFFGYLCQRVAHRYYPAYLWHNGEKVILEGNDWTNTSEYAQDVIQEYTLDFIRENKDNPFFLFVPHLIPHAELIAPEDSITDIYRKKSSETKNYFDSSGEGYIGNDYGSEDFQIWGSNSQPHPKTVFASMVSRLDHHVGEIVNLVHELGIDQNTIIIFTSDNGPHKEGGADPDFFNSSGFLRGYKRDLYEGGIRVPMIARWPGKIKPGSVTDHVSAFWDVLPTLAEVIGTTLPPENMDGLSFLPTLLGNEGQKEHDYLYWEFHELNGRIALRKGKWKAVRYNAFDKGSPIELYDLSVDIQESNNLASQFPEVVSEMKSLMKSARSDSKEFPFKVNWDY